MQLREFLLERYFDAHEFDVSFQLSASDCEALSVAELFELGGEPTEALTELRLGYTASSGDPALRAAIASSYPDCDADDILVVNAPQEGIFLSMHALLEPGDRVIVMKPCYQSLEEVARSLDCDVVEWPLVETADGWRLELELLEALLSEKTKLLVTNAPNNPTGLHPTQDQWRRIDELVREHDVHWFSDEMYRGLEDPAAALIPAASLSPSAVSLWGLSKAFGLPGLRLGWLVARDGDFVDRVRKLKDYTSICNNALSEVCGRVALGCMEAITTKNRERIERNVALMDAFVREHADLISWNPPVAGPVALARLQGESAAAHAEHVREKGDALLVPGTCFDLDEHLLRIGLGREDFPDALEAWSSSL